MREGGSCASHCGCRRLRSNKWRTRSKIFWQHRGSGGNGNLTGVAGEREGRGFRSWVVMGERREGDGFPVCWDVDGGRPGGRMILWWRWQRQVKDDGGEEVNRTAGGEGGAGIISKLRNNKQ